MEARATWQKVKLILFYQADDLFSRRQILIMVISCFSFWYISKIYKFVLHIFVTQKKIYIRLTSVAGRDWILCLCNKILEVIILTTHLDFFIETVSDLEECIAQTPQGSPIMKKRGHWGKVLMKTKRETIKNPTSLQTMASVSMMVLPTITVADGSSTSMVSWKKKRNYYSMLGPPTQIIIIEWIFNNILFTLQCSENMYWNDFCVFKLLWFNNTFNNFQNYLYPSFKLNI